MADARATAWANPFSPHGPGRAAADALDRARAQVAALLGRPAAAVSFTGGATEANSWTLSRAPTPERPEVLVSAVEHPSVRAWATGAIPVDARGVVQLDALDRLLRASAHRTAVVSVMLANNETGVVQPVAEVARVCAAHGVPFHCDASQAPGRIDVSGLPADWITLSAHKFGGPRGIGALVADQPPPALLRGGPQERGRRAGTPDVVAAVGMAAAAAELAELVDPGPRDALERACVRLGAEVLGAGAPRLPNTTAVLFDVPGEMVVIGLDLEGISVSTGSACSSGAAEPSHVLAAMGREGVPVRLSLGPDSDVDAAIAALERVLGRIRGAA